MKKLRRKTLYGYTLTPESLEDMLEWHEGNGGCEYAVIDHVFRNIRAMKDNLPTHMADRLVKVRITLEEVEIKHKLGEEEVYDNQN